MSENKSREFTQSGVLSSSTPFSQQQHFSLDIEKAASISVSMTSVSGLIGSYSVYTTNGNGKWTPLTGLDLLTLSGTSQDDFIDLMNVCGQTGLKVEATASSGTGVLELFYRGVT